MRQNSYRLASLACTLPSILGFARLTSCSAPPRLLLPPFNLSYPPCPLSPIPFLFKPLRTLAHSFALTKNSTPFFSSDSALFGQNNRGWAYLCKSHSFPLPTQEYDLPPIYSTYVDQNCGKSSQNANGSQNNDVASAVWG